MMSTPISIHQRSYETEAFDEGDGNMRVVGRLVDTKPHGLALVDGEPLVIHDMVVEMIVAGDTFEIVDITVTMNVHPYGQCTSVLDSYRQLIGISIARGYTRKVKELFGGPMGCSHVGALLTALAPVAVQASYSLASLHNDLATWLDADDVDSERRLRLNTNTCHVWRADGDQITRLERGEQAARPDWEVVRLKKLGL